MTERHAGYLVVLDEDIREDDAQAILTALRMVKSVASVTPVPASYDQVIARDRRDGVWASALRELARNGPEQD